MASHPEPAADQAPRPRRPRSRLFVLRLWTEQMADGSELRGVVFDPIRGANRGFRAWPDLIAFLIA
jgi:hypothetical protein